MTADRANIVIEGRPVPLDPRGALALGMAIHELATDAVNYGDLSVPEGNVAVTRKIEKSGDDDCLALDWVERHGPPVTKTDRRGCVTKSVKRSLSHDLAGEPKVAFLPDGVYARLTDVVGGLGKTTGPE